MILPGRWIKELVLICSHGASCSMWMFRFLIVSRERKAGQRRRWWGNAEVDGGRQKSVRVFQSTWSYWPGRTSTWQLAARGHGRVFFCVYVQMCGGHHRPAGGLPVMYTQTLIWSVSAAASPTVLKLAHVPSNIHHITDKHWSLSVKDSTDNKNMIQVMWLGLRSALEWCKLIST